MLPQMSPKGAAPQTARDAVRFGSQSTPLVTFLPQLATPQRSSRQQPKSSGKPVLSSSSAAAAAQSQPSPAKLAEWCLPKLDLSAVEHTVELQHFYDEVAQLTSLPAALELQLSLQQKLEGLEKKLSLLAEYLVSINGAKMLPSEKQQQRIEAMDSSIALARCKLQAVAAQVATIEGAEKEQKRRQSRRRVNSEEANDEGSEVRAFKEQQDRLRTAGTEVFEPLLKLPLGPKDVATRLRNELILPWVLRICSLSPEQVENSDALVQWVLHEFCDDHSVSEILKQVPETVLLCTASRLLAVFYPSLIASPHVPRPAVHITRPSLAQRMLPDFTRIALQAVAQGAMDTLSLVISTPNIRLQKALLDREMVALILYATVMSGHIESLALLLKLGFYHSHVLHAVLFLTRNEPALFVERFVSVKCAAEWNQIQIENATAAVKSEMTEELHDSGRGNSPRKRAWEEEPVDVDALLTAWESKSEVTSSAGGYQETPLDKSLQVSKPSSFRGPSRVPVFFTQLLESGRFSSIRRNLGVQAVPYFSTDCVKRFGDKAFASTCDVHHVAVRADVPVTLRRSQEPHRHSDSRFAYFEVHVAVDALTCGEDPVHVGWCDEHFPADGVTHAVVGNDEHSAGISFVAADTVARALHGRCTAKSSSSVIEGSASAFSMRARSRASGFGSRFSSSGEVIVTPVKHFNGHSQRQFANETLNVLVSLDSDEEPYRQRSPESAATTRRTSSSVATAAQPDGEERYGSATLAECMCEIDLYSPAPIEFRNATSRADVLDSVGIGAASTTPMPFLMSASGGGGSHSNQSACVANEKEKIDGCVTVVGCLLDTEASTMTFYIDGVSLGVSFDSLPPKASTMYPCASLVRFRQSTTSPTIRFCFEQDELRYLPVLPSSARELAPTRSSTTSTSSLPGSWSATLLGADDNSDVDPALLPPLLPTLQQLHLLDVDAKIAHLVHLMSLPELQKGIDIQDSNGPSSQPSSPAVPKPPPSIFDPASPSCGLPEPCARDDLSKDFPVGTRCLNKRCVDRRMYFMPIALVNESVELGVEHQELDVAVLCCAANPTPLMFALFQRRRKAALAIAQSTLVDVEACDTFGVKPLLVACGLGYGDVVAAILKRSNSDQLFAAYRGYTPLHVAIMSEHEWCVNVLLQCAFAILGSDRVALGRFLNAATPRGNTPLLLACKLKSVSIVRQLLQCGADATLVEKRNHHSPLLVACRDGSEAIAELLLSSKQYHRHQVLNTPSKDGLGVPLCWAAQRGMTNLIPMFADAGADPRIPFGDTEPLVSAIACNHEETALSLIENFLRHVDPSKLKYAVLDATGHLQPSKKHDEVLEPAREGTTVVDDTPPRVRGHAAMKFHTHAVDPKTQNSVLHLACELNLRRVVDTLLSYGALICSVNKQFATPLHVTLAAGHEDLALHLLRQGKDMLQEGISAFDITLMDAKGDTVLHVAARCGMVRVVEAILDMFSAQEVNHLIARTRNKRIKQLDILASNRQGDNVFQVAIKAKQPQVAEILLAAADPLVDLAPGMTAHNNTAVMECLDNGFLKLARLLVNRGATVTADVRSEINQRWDMLMSAQTPATSRRIRRQSLSFGPVDSSTASHLDEPFSSFGVAKSPKMAGSSSLTKVKSVCHMLATKLAESQKVTSIKPVRRRSTIQRMFRPVAARFDDSVASHLLRLFHPDELLYEFECILGFSTLTAPEVLEHGEVIVSALLAHGHVCFSASEASTLARAAYSFLQSKASTANIGQRKEIAKRQAPFGAQVFQIIRRYSPAQGGRAVEALTKAFDVHRVFAMKQSTSPLKHTDLPVVPFDEALLVNPFSGVTALQLAVYLGLTDVVTFLCEVLNVDPMGQGMRCYDSSLWLQGVSCLFPLRIAIVNSHTRIASVLLEQPRCLLHVCEAPDVWPSRCTLLHSAVITGSSATVELLLDREADVGGCNADGDDVWLLAAREKTGAIMGLLLDKGLTPNCEFLREAIAPASAVEACAEVCLSARSNDAVTDSSTKQQPTLELFTTEEERSVLEPPRVGFIVDEDSFMSRTKSSAGATFSAIASRNIDYYGRWFDNPFIDGELFEDPVNEDELSSTRRGVKRTVDEAYQSALLFTCVRYIPSKVLHLLRSASIKLNVTHPCTEDSLLTFIINEACTTDKPPYRSGMVSLASQLLVQFGHEIVLSSVRSDGESALSLAARLGDLDLIALLLDLGAPVLAGKQQQQQQSSFSSGQSAAANPRKVVTWRLLAQLFYSVEREPLLLQVLKMLEHSTATRRAFLTAVFPNLHPLLVLKVASIMSSDVVTICISNQPGSPEANLAFWAMIHYVLGFIPEHAKTSCFLSKRLLENVVFPLTPTIPSAVLITLQLLRQRQKEVRELQTLARQQSISKSAALPAAARRSSGVVFSGIATRRSSGMTPLPAESVRPSPQPAAGETSEPTAMFLLAPGAPSARRPSAQSNRESSRHSVSVPPESEKSPEDVAILVPALDSPDTNQPLHLLNTPAGLQLALPSEGSPHFGGTLTPHVGLAASQISGGAAAPQQRGISLEVLFLKLSDMLIGSLRESSGSSMVILQPLSDSQSLMSTADSASSSPVQQVPGTESGLHLERFLDIAEISLRFGMDDILEYFKGWLSASTKFNTLIKDRHLIAMSCVACNPTALPSLIVSHADVMTLDEIDVATGCPQGIAPSNVVQRANSIAGFHRDTLMAGFRQERGEASTNCCGAQNDRAKRQSARGSSTAFRFSVDGSAKTAGQQSLARRLSYDAATAAAKAASTGTSSTVAATLPGALPSPPPTVSSPRRASMKKDPVPPPAAKMHYCLFDWAVHSHYFLRHAVPTRATLDTVSYLADRRCPLSYQLMLFLLASTNDGDQLIPPSQYADQTVNATWRTTAGLPIGVNTLTQARGDSWLHILVMHNQIILVDCFLQATRSRFLHKGTRNHIGLTAADYCTSYQMSMVLHAHGCITMGLNSMVSTTFDHVNVAALSKARREVCDVCQLLIVPRDFLHILDDDNSGIDKRLQIPSIGRDYEQQEAFDANDSFASEDGVSPPTPSSKGAERAIPRPPTSRIADEIILRNQRSSQRYLQEVFLPRVLYETVANGDNLRVHSQLLGGSRSPVTSQGTDTPLLDVSSRTISPRAKPTLDVSFLNSSSSVSKSFGSSDIPISIKMLKFGVPAGVVTVAPVNPQTSSAQKQDVLSPKSPTGRSSRARTAQINKAKTLSELVDLLQQNLFSVFVEELQNGGGGKEAMSFSVSDTSPYVKGSSSRALFITLPLFQFAFKAGLLRLQNHRVAPYDQLDGVVATCASALYAHDRMRNLEKWLEDVGGSVSLANLGLEISPRYHGR